MNKIENKYITKILFVIVMLLQLTGCTEESSPVAPVRTMNSDNPLKSALDKTVDQVLEKYYEDPEFVGVSIGIYKGGNENYYNYGETVNGGKTLPSKNTIYEIGSVSKTFTGAIMVGLINEGLLNLDQPIVNYLPNYVATQNFGSTNVTLRTLAAHSGGFSNLPDDFLSDGYDANNPFNHYDTNKVFNYLKTNRCNYKPGSKVEYSNLGMALVAIICSRVTNKSYEVLVKERILNQLDMASTRVNNSADSDPLWSTGYDDTGKRVNRITASAFQGAGFLSSSLSDMMKYAKAQLGIGPTWVTTLMQRTQDLQFFDSSLGIGYGWDWVINPEAKNYFHDGRTPGFRSFVLFNSDSKTAIVCLFNSSGIEQNSKLEAMFYELALSVLK